MTKHRTMLSLILLECLVTVVAPFSTTSPLAPPSVSARSKVESESETTYGRIITNATSTSRQSLPQPIDQLIALSLHDALKRPGSESHRRSWNRFSNVALDHIQNHLLEILPITPDQAATDQLGFELGVAADHGTMPSFGVSGARAGYALQYFCRTRLLSDIMFAARMRQIRLEENGIDNKNESDNGNVNGVADFGQYVDDMLCGSQSTCNIGSLGGGPGFDFVAAALLAAHSGLERKARVSISASLDRGEEELISLSDARLQSNDITTIQATVYEYELGWNEITPYMEQSVSAILGGEHTCNFAGCDITLPLTHKTNSACLEQVDSTDIWVCSYCVAENAVRLRESDCVFFRELFERAHEGVLFIFTETTHRLWPELIDVATCAADDRDCTKRSGFDISFPRIDRGRGKAGFQLALRKNSASSLEPYVEEMCAKFRRDAAAHKRKVEAGYSRQAKKIKGAKQLD